MHTDFMGRQIMFCQEFCSTTNHIAGVDNCAIVRFLMACVILYRCVYCLPQPSKSQMNGPFLLSVSADVGALLCPLR